MRLLADPSVSLRQFMKHFKSERTDLKFRNQTFHIRSISLRARVSECRGHCFINEGAESRINNEKNPLIRTWAAGYGNNGTRASVYPVCLEIKRGCSVPGSVLQSTCANWIIKSHCGRTSIRRKIQCPRQQWHTVVKQIITARNCAITETRLLKWLQRNFTRNACTRNIVHSYS